MSLALVYSTCLCDGFTHVLLTGFTHVLLTASRFIVELCELVELYSVQIACFELFSSIPESFNVSVSER